MTFETHFTQVSWAPKIIEIRIVPTFKIMIQSGYNFACAKFRRDWTINSELEKNDLEDVNLHKLFFNECLAGHLRETF